MTQLVPATAQLGPGKTGLAIGYRVLDIARVQYSAFTTTNVAETGTAGTYSVAGGVVCPNAGGYIVWGVSGTDYVESTVDSDVINSVLGTIGGLSSDAKQDVADAGLLAPTAGTPATGGVYDLLTAIEVLAGAGVSGGAEYTSTPDHWGGGTGSSVAFSDHWDIITPISPNTAGGYNPPGDFGAVRMHLTSPYVAGVAIGSALLSLGLQGAGGNFAIKIELLAAPASLWGSTYAERSWGTEVVLATGTNYDLELHAIDVTALVAELLASVPVGTSISYLVFGISPTGGNSPSVTFSDGNTLFPTLTLTEALVLSGLTKQDVADAGLLAPSTNTPATGSMYDLLANVGTGSGTVEPAQLDWSAWTTPDGALADLYDDNAVDELTHSGTTLAAEGDTGFAAWVLQEFDGKLFVGVGKTPMNHIAAVIGSLATAGATPTFEYALPEEGVAAMCAGTDDKLYVAGTDERANTGDSSIYIRTTAGTWTRKQTVTGWQHICGIREDGMLWIAGQGAASVLMYSTDGGNTWTDTDLALGRAYDVIRLGAAAIATHWDGATTYTVRRSLTTPSFSWSAVSGIEGGTGRMVEWEGVIVGVTVSGKLFTVDSDGAGLEYTPPFTPRQGWNNLAVDTDGYLCVLGTTGVWRTNDLANWKQVWSFSPADTVRSLGTWGADLVVSTDGATAQVLARPASPEAAQQQMYRDALKLAASPGTAATGSTDADLADILTDTAAIKAITDDIDVSAVTLATGNNAGDLTFIVGATFDETLTGLTVIPDDWTACYFSLKRDKDSDSDVASLIQVKVTNGGDVSDGLLYVQGSAPTSPVTKANASLTVTQAAGTVRIVVSAAAMALLTGGLSSLDWDLKVFRTGGWSKVVTSGNAQIAWTPTRAV